MKTPKPLLKKTKIPAPAAADVWLPFLVPVGATNRDKRPPARASQSGHVETHLSRLV